MGTEPHCKQHILCLVISYLWGRVYCICTRIAALTRFSQAVSEHGNSSSKTGGCSLNILYTGKGCGIKILVSRKGASASFCPFGFVSFTAALSLFLFLAPTRWFSPRIWTMEFCFFGVIVLSCLVYLAQAIVAGRKPSGSELKFLFPSKADHIM